jgi:FkbM family methyltransferase
MSMNMLAWIVNLVAVGGVNVHGTMRNLAPLVDTSSSLLLQLDTKPVVATDAAVHLQERLVEHSVPPVSCSRVLMQVRNGETTDPNQGKLYSRYTSASKPSFWVSVHNQKYDGVRYEIFEGSGHYYERSLSDAFTQVLSGKQGRVLDVGGNIGWFALLSAANGAQVATFEPHRINYLRTCESMCLNGWLQDRDGGSCMNGGVDPFVQERIQIFPYGVTDEAKELFFEENHSNPGQGRTLNFPTNATTSIQGVTLDDMVEALGWTFGDIDILKVDVEGAEVQVLSGAKQLLKSNRVQNIFMKGNIRSSSEMKDFETLVTLLVDSGYVVYKFGGRNRPTDKSALAFDHNFYSNLMKECGGMNGGVPRLQCNLWWKPKSSGATSAQY